MDGWNISFLLGWPIFRGYISFRECISSYQIAACCYVSFMSWRLLLRCFVGHQFGDFHQFYPCFFTWACSIGQPLGLKQGSWWREVCCFAPKSPRFSTVKSFEWMTDGWIEIAVQTPLILEVDSWNRFDLKKTSRCATLHPLTYRSLQSSIPSCYWTKYGHRCMHLYIYTCTCIGIDNWKIDMKICI